MKRKSNKKFLLLVFILLIAVLIFAFLKPSVKQEPNEFVKNMTTQSSEDLFFVYQTIKYPSNVEIIQFSPEEQGTTIGLVADPWNLNFGIVPNGGNAGRRFLVLTNLQDSDAKIEFNTFGNISSMVSFNKNNFILHKGEEVKVDIILTTTDMTQPGNYTGEIDIIIKRSKYNFIKVF